MLATLRRVYLAMVIPQITYGCSVCGIHPTGEKGHTAKMCAMLTKIQLEAARVIAGAYRATSAVALDVELFILPMRQQLEKRAHETVLNIRSGSWAPGLETGYQRTGRGLDRRRRPQVSPLTRINRSLERKLGVETLKDLETREPFVVEPWWTPTPHRHRGRPGGGRTTTRTAHCRASTHSSHLHGRQWGPREGGSGSGGAGAQRSH